MYSLWDQYVIFSQYFELHQFRSSCFWINNAGDITPPNGIKVAMEMQAEAERRKSAQVLESEGNDHTRLLFFMPVCCLPCYMLQRVKLDFWLQSQIADSWLADKIVVF
jgi:hypothetical protein